jgi:hypothetical protein
MPGAGLSDGCTGKALSDMPAFQPYWGKPAVRNDRGDSGNVGIIRSPLRATVLPDCGGAISDGRPYRDNNPKVRVADHPPSRALVDADALLRGQLIDDWSDPVVSTQVTKLVHLQNPRAPGPSGDIALQERRKILCARWKLLAAITDLIKVQIHDGVNQSAHHHFSVSACS